MSWPGSIVVALLAALSGCVLAGFVATLCVDWYDISSFEGKSGYFVVAMALLGAVAGLLVGIVVSRFVAGMASPGMLKAIGASQLAVVAIAGVVAGMARLSADVAPRLAGDELLLVVEVRWPASQLASPARDSSPRRIRLHSLSGRTSRTSREGPLWVEDARQVDGRWVAPGAVEVFTSRGGRMLSLDPTPERGVGFELPLPAYPRAAQLQWSEWLPRTRAASSPDGFSVRYRVLPRSQPVRTQRFGAFEVSTIASGFYTYAFAERPAGLAASATFTIRHRGVPVVAESASDSAGGVAQRFDRFASVALLPGAPDALLVRGHSDRDGGPVFLLVADGERVRSQLVATEGGQHLDPPLVTNDVERFRQARELNAMPGIVDETTYAQPGVFLFGGALLSTSPPAVRRFTETGDARYDPNVRPLGLSPDGRHVVRVGFAEDYEGRELVVTDAETGVNARVPIDAARTRLGTVSDLDPAWLQHYYAWTEGSDGVLRLEARRDVKPLPYRGVLTVASDGYREYHVKPAGEAMFEALKSFLVAEMGATRTPEDLAAYGHQVHVNGQVVHVLNHTEYQQVGVFMDRGIDSRLVETIGKRFDAALATGRYDSLFTH
jgi:hypothetical protein